VLAWALYAVISPFQQVTAYVITGATDIWEEYIMLHDVRLENRELKQELGRLHRENQKLEETLALVGGEMELKSFQLLYEETYGYKPINAVVIGAGSGSSSYIQSLIVNKGSLDGVKLNNGVISPHGVVGKVIQVGPTSSLVQLITDPLFSMAARLHESRVAGMVSGLGKDSMCVMQYVRDTDPIEVGDRVVSSGLDQIFPRGILIGRVTSVNQEGMPSFKQVEVLPAVNLRSLEWVTIVEWPESTKIEN
jgi:rod shape-determining protein MreC